MLRCNAIVNRFCPTTKKNTSSTCIWWRWQGSLRHPNAPLVLYVIIVYVRLSGPSFSAPLSSTIRHVPSLFHLTETEKLSFANILSMITKLYDNLFSCSFAYSTGIHQRPIPPEDEYIDSGDEAKITHFHVPGPPLLRRVSVRKFLVGYMSCLVIGYLHRRSRQSESTFWTFGRSATRHHTQTSR